MSRDTTKQRLAISAEISKGNARGGARKARPTAV
jgi:hypothetical protein